MPGIQFPEQGSGTFAAKVLDNSVGTTNVLEASKPIKIEAVWQIDAESARVLGGRWEVAAYAESIGPGAEILMPPVQTVPLNGGTNYGTVIVVPPNTFPDNPAPGASGVYKIVIVLLLRNFGNITDVAAIDEAPLLRIG
ncbi:hypothetical protein GCM10009557_61820 [Virgisporangium ochraceum]|uniref:Uncharacterized protein n=1 Tax=Virgisporangium ochraceum TaxID=65505 RepID=A0A8J3ZVQ2_9ACTN|nr:hypothetical protein [Virgisporangium ochraceum]GIJ70844.1 hypothetical protein Voc01_057610 [Virgisporangium ochraceum]